MAVQAALKFWHEFDIQQFQHELDSEAQLVAKRQDDSEASRKKLVELSRDFKKTAPEELRRKVTPLLKSFQAEVDSLSRRGRDAETAFLSGYRKIASIPDPTAVLEQAVSTQQRLALTQDQEIEVKQLRETLQEYNSEFAHVKNQEGTITRLKEQLREMEDRSEERAAAKVAEKAAEILRSFQEKERDLQSIAASAQASLQQAEVKAATMQTALESTQSELFELKNKFDEVATAKAAELDILSTELERTNHRASVAEKEVERLQLQQTERPSPATQLSSERVEVELELQARDKEISRLVADVQSLQNGTTRLREAASVQSRMLEEQLALKTASLTELERQLAAQSDYEELKRELSVIKMIEFSSASNASALEGEKIASPTKPLEVLLLEKNRSLQNENTTLKLELSELRNHFSSLKQQQMQSLHSMQEQRELIGQLEMDLSRVRPYLPVRTEGEGQDSSSAADIISEAVRGAERPKRQQSEEDAAASSAASLLPIVSSQRERFKQRNTELEAECRQQKQNVTVLQREVDSLRGDNVKLYEKIKFLQSYPGTRKSVEDPDVMGRYSSQYEANLDPFAAFGSRERQRRYTQLSGTDKATLVLGRFILSSKVARMVALCYTVALHLLVFLVLAKLSYAESCAKDFNTDCVALFSEHMQAVHPEHVKDFVDTFGKAAMGDNDFG